MSSSTAHPGTRRRTARTTSANCDAPPSGRSSRATAVTTAWARPIDATASARRAGSPGSGGPLGSRVSTRQNPHARVQRSPLIMNVAVPCCQHSKMFGQPASSHTVTRSLRPHRALQAAVLRAHERLDPDPFRLALVEGQAFDRRHPRRGHAGAIDLGAPHRGRRRTTASTTSAIETATPSAASDVTAYSADPARHDVAEHRHVRVDVQREAVHRAAPRHPHADGADLAVADQTPG